MIIVWQPASKHKEYAISLGMNPENISVINGVGGVNHKLYDKSIEYLKNQINLHISPYIYPLLNFDKN